ncbi:type II secretion system protein [Francisella sp. 19X1-34]|uniref:type II secretion system protein n=1 Tax=Francisella sp. 19X1-34 TaxID=3087177 RepID=UPI002E334764|nr:type II secretion system protein [Francisella sp. 19X1-34]MED7788326.1 type II secretion system protein [Francisella sp. 19X1-34]
MKILRNKGFTILEVLISSALVMFLFFTIFYTIGNIISRAILIEKKVELADELDDRVSDFMLSGTFNDNSLGNITFSKSSDLGESIQEFVATNPDMELTVTQRIYASNPVADAINDELGAYMQRANEIYINAGVEQIDDPAVLTDINTARDSLLSSSTEKHSSSTGVLLNLSNTQINTTQPLDNPPFDSSGQYVVIGPNTNADITSSGVTWRCTAYNFDTELLPGWCSV